MKRVITITRLSAVVMTVALFVLATPTSASAQCSNPTAPGSKLLPGTQCPEGTATTASALVWGLAVIALILWLVRTMTRLRSTTDADVQVIDTVFSHPETTEDAISTRHMTPAGTDTSTAVIRPTPPPPSWGPAASDPVTPAYPPPPPLPPRQ
ncbi:hypothetical protein P8605_21045 [Streptomyces sp. T-3]|nr:hypothetical protein [Streptomyces sp. T-3]